MTGFVVDSSILAAWLLPDENNILAEQALSSAYTNDVFAPDLLRHEIRNVLVIVERRGRISADAVDTLLARLRKVSIRYI